MKTRIAALGLVAATLALGWTVLARPVPGPQPDGSILLPNGWRIRPAGTMLPAGSLPLAIALAPDGRVLALSSGYGVNGVVVLDPVRGTVDDTVRMRAAWLGLAVRAADSTAFVAGGITNRVLALRLAGGRWLRRDSVALADSGAAVFVGGLALSPDGRRLAVLGNLCDSLFVLDAATLRRIGAARTGDHPYAPLFSPDGRSVLVSNWGDSTVGVFSVQGDGVASAGMIPVAPRPSALALTRDGRTLFVAHAGANAVSVVDVAARRVEATIGLGLTPRAPEGSGPNALALSPDERTLYVANADNNAVAVVRLGGDGGPQVAGFIPTGWYPTAVAVSADGRRLYVANGKGAGSAPNPRGPLAPGAGREQYVGNLITGSLSVIPVPDEGALQAYTRQVLENSPYRDALLSGAQWPGRSPIPRAAGEASPIRYVVYVIKENRTYDQVFGDLPRGNGDPRLTIFGESVTPNQHALARQFVLFDNFYVDGEVSADGHLWSTAAYASDYNQKTWPASYSSRREYDFDAGLPVNDPLAGYLWDSARRAGLTLRNYGEMTRWDSVGLRAIPEHPGLAGVTDERYSGFVMTIPDTARASEFIRELREFERSGDLPRLVILYLPRNHTVGRQAGQPTPRAMVADNDLALGRVVDALSHSRFWRRLAMFVLEDDAQNGADHVDAHRSPMLVIGPYVRRGVVDSTFYTTASVLRTIELILGLPPLSQYDAGATPLFNAFTTTPAYPPFRASRAQWPLEERNPPRQPARSSLDPRSLRRPDLADEEALNREIWESVLGDRVPMPAPRHAPLLARGAAAPR